ncbi:MAG: SH3 domain-containing protein [Chloroflexi bacterium]|nr:SH3 domain-containing protein [Chloroflexota bacterium]
MKDFAEDAANAAKTYYVTANPYANVRSCASTNCDIVATAENGEALTVIDDSQDWYEIRLENGETAFIAGFLMSKTKP